MAIGDYDRRIALRKRVLTKDTATGQEREDWPLTASSPRYWCSVRPLSANETIASGVLQSGSTLRFTLRGRIATIAAVDRLEFEGATYAITGVLVDGTETIVTASQPST